MYQVNHTLYYASRPTPQNAIFIPLVGTYGATSAKRYKVEITNAKIDRSTPGNREASSEADNDPRRNPDLTKMFSGNFSFVRTDDGSIPATYFSREDNTDLVNSKKAIVAAFQANFKGTKVKQEADTQSLHKAEYRYNACRVIGKKHGKLRIVNLPKSRAILSCDREKTRKIARIVNLPKSRAIFARAGYHIARIIRATSEVNSATFFLLQKPTQPFCSLYSYSASAQDVANGIQRMRRTITSDDVEGYAHHMPKEEVGLKKVEDLEYRRGVLTHASGTTNCKLMPKV